MLAELSDDLYIRFRDLLRTRCGLEYPEHKRSDLAYGLIRAMGTTRHANLMALYADALASGPGWEAIITHLTIGETYFFRNDAQFEALRNQIVPELRDRHASTHTLRCWSAGCATGEEPYSLAILLNELVPNTDSWNVSVLATDINPQFLARAREALYGNWSFRETPDSLRERFWTAEQGRWRLHPLIRRMVTFAELNLAEPCYPAIANGTCALDIIVCRNVTIYFDAATTRQVAERFYRSLAPGGWLIVGHAEPQASVYHQFEVHNFPNTVIYRKPLDAPLFAVEPATMAFNADTRPSPKPASVQVAAEMLDPVNQQVRHISSSLEQLPKPQAAILVPPHAASAPADVTAQLEFGRLYADQGDWVQARQQCLLALTANPLSIPAHYLLAQIHEHQAQYDAALAAYRRTVYLDPSFVPGMLGMGNIWRQLGHTANAQRIYRNALHYLAKLPATATIPGSDGANAHDMLALIQQLLEQLEHVSM